MIDVIYRCRCLKSEVTVQVRYRTPSEDLGDWMALIVQPTVQLDHARRSPGCRAKSMEYAKIERPENEPFIGGKPVVH